MGGGVLGRELALVGQSLELGGDRRALLGVGGFDCAEAAQNRDKTNTKTATYAHFPMLGSGRPMFRRLSFIALRPNRLGACRVAVGTTRRANPVSARARQFGRQRAAAVDVRQPRQDEVGDGRPEGADRAARRERRRRHGRRAPVRAVREPGRQQAAEVRLRRRAHLRRAAPSRAGRPTTGSKAFITLQGTPYEVSDLVLQAVRRRLRAVAQEPAESAQGGLVLGALGIDFRKLAQEPAQRGRGDRSVTRRRSRSPARPTSPR